MMNWLQTLDEFQQSDTDCVMVTVASIMGSTPREVGAKMIVTVDRLFGTIGGGNLEFQACRIAREMLSSPEPKQLKRFPLGAGLGQCCGGLVNLLFEPVIGVCDWVRVALDYEGLDKAWVREVPMGEGESVPVVRRYIEGDETSLSESRFIEVSRSGDIELTLFGAGHVGRAIVNALRDLPVKVRWVDGREEEFPADIPRNVEIIDTDTPEAEVDAAAPGSCFLVMTHDHALDQSLCEAILKRDDFVYFGLIGSRSKRRMFETRMKRRGIDENLFAQMTCPIGVDGISSKQPSMIAISVVAQLMQVYDAQVHGKKQKPEVFGRYSIGGHSVRH